MRTTKVFSITMPPSMAKQAERLARKENRTMSELMREAFRRYHQQQLGVNTDLLSALLAVQEDAKRVGLDRLTNREINAEIAAYRVEQANRRVKEPLR
jgi:Arc/MetJ-type ribon-helix-helix transcriptional regulator